MCNAFSCILKSDLSIVPNPRPDVHSHEAQARAAGILDSIGSDAYQRVECVPEGFDYASDPMTWTVRVDEERRASWVDENWPEIEDRVRRAAARWIASRGIRDDGSYVVGYDETRIVLSGSKATITVKDGRVYTCGTSSPMITMSDGWVSTYGASSPTITQSGGVVCTCGTSSPTITVSGGYVYIHDSSSPTITVSGGVVCTYGASSPTITMSDGWVSTYGASSPTITQSGGVVCTYGTSSPTITVSGGYVYIHDSSSPTITVSGGDVYVFSGSSSPKITRVAKE